MWLTPRCRQVCRTVGGTASATPTGGIAPAEPGWWRHRPQGPPVHTFIRPEQSDSSRIRRSHLSPRASGTPAVHRPETHHAPGHRHPSPAHRRRRGPHGPPVRRGQRVRTAAAHGEGTGPAGAPHRLVRAWHHREPPGPGRRRHRRGTARRLLVGAAPGSAARTLLHPCRLLRPRRRPRADRRGPPHEPDHPARARQPAPRHEPGVVERQAQPAPRQPQPRGQGPGRRRGRPGLQREARGRPVRTARLAHPPPGLAVLPADHPRGHRPQDLRLPGRVLPGRRPPEARGAGPRRRAAPRPRRRIRGPAAGSHAVGRQCCSPSCTRWSSVLHLGMAFAPNHKGWRCPTRRRARTGATCAGRSSPPATSAAATSRTGSSAASTTRSSTTSSRACPGPI
ncbi:hypothetical protein RKD22_007252 [Streptomyces pristinaespiralis]